VLVACGTYYEHDIVMTSGVCLRSETGEADCVTIDAQEQGRGIYCDFADSAATASIEGFTITGGDASGSVGGGMYCLRSSPRLTNLVFTDNLAWNGGGMYCGGGSAPMLANVDFVSNSAVGTWPRGGGMYCDTAAAPVLTGVRFLANTANGGGGGAGMCCRDSSPTLTYVTFAENFSSGWGGGMGFINSDATLSHVVFSGNTAETLAGGGLCTDASFLTLSRVTFDGNTAGSRGGAMTSEFGSGCTLEHVTFVGNSADYGGDAIACHMSSWAELTNCIIAFSTQGEAVRCYDSSTASLTCCDVFGNVGGDWIDCIADQNGVNGNFSLDPLFCWDENPDEPLTLREDSPCAAGNNPACGQVGAFGVDCDALGGECEIAVSDTLLSFGPRFIGAVTADTLLVTNAGTLWLRVDDISTDHADFSAEPTSFFVDPDQSQPIVVEFAPSIEGPITGTLTILSSDPDHPMVEVTLEGVGVVGPEISVAPDSLFAELMVDETETQSITVENSGGRELVWSLELAGAYDGWLSAEPDTGAVSPGSSQDVAVTFDASDLLLGGDYFADIVITSNDPYDPEIRVPAQLHVTGFPDIAVSDTLLSYGRVLAGRTLTNTLAVANVGTDLLTVYDVSAEPDAYSAVPTSFVLEPAESLGVEVSFSPNADGPFPGMLTILSDDADQGSIEIPLQGEGILGGTIHVPADQPTIQAGINAVGAGDTVLVACGTYDEHDIVMKSGVTLRSETGQADCATIDAQELGRVMYCENLEETTAIEGFTLSNGYTVTGGGGVMCSLSSPTFRNCRLADNIVGYDEWSPNDGGGMYCQESSPVLIGCEFSNNYAYSDGGGLFCQDSSPVLTGCTFLDNTTDPYNGQGGGMACLESSAALSNCTFVGNSASGPGAALVSWDSSFTLTNCILAFHTGGDAVHCIDGGSAALTCCDVFGNEAGDWIGCIADQYGVDGNILGDPLFCDPWQGDLTLAAGSPCAPESNPECGLIGACGVACDLPGPRIGVSDTLLTFRPVCVGEITSETVVVSNLGPAWLAVTQISIDHDDFSADPSTFVLPPGDSREVEVVFTPSSVGTIAGTLTIQSSDPALPEVRVALEAEGLVPAGHISSSDDHVSFGPVFIGAAGWEVLTVSNIGCGPLTVSDISTDHSDFSADPAALTIPPDGTGTVVVVFAPSSEGTITGTLTITSDDPDDGTLEIALEGEGLVPPEIEVSPDSLSADLPTGQTETHILTIENSGGSELVWSARAVADTGARSRGFRRLNAPAAKISGGGHAAPLEASAVPLGGRSTRLADLTGVQVLWDQAHGQTSWGHVVIISNLECRGATVTRGNEPLTSSLLSNFGVVWITDCSDTWTFPEVQALADWVLGGGSLLLEGDSDSSVAAYNEILVASSAGIEYSPVAGTAGYTTIIYSHPTTVGVGRVYLNDNEAHLSAVMPPASVLLDDRLGLPNTAWSKPGIGRSIAMADDITDDGHIGYWDTELFANQVFDWLAGGSTCAWLTCDPTSGTVPVGESVEVEVTFDAADLVGGDYLAEVIVRSNDLDDPETALAAHLHVTGVPDIAVSAMALDFGVVEVGAAVAETLLVVNEGTDLLTVSGVSTDHGDFSVDPTSFALPPAESQAVTVEFTPSTEGLIAGTLTILSDDPDEGSLLVALEGTGEHVTPVEGSFYAVLTESESVMLRWTVSSMAGIDGFSVYRAPSPEGPFARVNDEPIPASSPASFEDTGVWPETTFWYELRALLADGTEDVVDGGLTSVTTSGRLAARLYPAHPNPLTTRTSIRLDVPAHVGGVTLAVYGIGGQLVRRLSDGAVGRGRHVVTWDGRDERGMPVSAGVYFVRLEAGGEVRTQKIAVAR